MAMIVDKMVQQGPEGEIILFILFLLCILTFEKNIEAISGGNHGHKRRHSQVLDTTLDEMVQQGPEGEILSTHFFYSVF